MLCSELERTMIQSRYAKRLNLSLRLESNKVHVFLLGMSI